jgi:hypothetical protein
VHWLLPTGMVAVRPLLAHAFGQSYTLPVPLWLYLYGAAAAVVLSFVVVSYVVGQPQAEIRPARAALRVPRPLIRAARVASLALAGLVVLTGIIGSQNALNNLNVTFFWIIFLLGFTYLTALVGNLWPYLSPVVIFLDIMKRLTGVTLRPRIAYPAWLAYYPALLSYGVLIWLELLSSSYGAHPSNLSRLLAVYGLVTLLGIGVFGQQVWLKYGEFFSIFFTQVARLAPIEYRGGRVQLRPPLSGLTAPLPAPFSLVLFIIFMLASTSFDGLSETGFYGNLFWRLASWPLLAGAAPWAIGTLLLLAAPAVYALAYYASIGLMKLAARSGLSVRELGARFIYSLIPIAVAYNMAHYFTLLVVNGQLMVKLAGDPFGWGWNWLHTASYQINVGLLGAAQVWYIEVGLIVAGHILGVYAAHLEALRIFAKPKQAILSQYPMLVLMVLYTVAGLWIIAQPIAGR